MLCLYFSLIPVDYCHLVILNIFPNNIESQVTSQGPREVFDLFRHSYVNFQLYMNRIIKKKILF